ncbi:MAG: hypothetical protein E6J90_23855 [Deltaproteobacteria bacterium]|nr:MAG: hypothetical protein E6J90_23855 [Deltaproteobacteria bacterium]
MVASRRPRRPRCRPSRSRSSPRPPRRGWPVRRSRRRPRRRLRRTPRRRIAAPPWSSSRTRCAGSGCGGGPRSSDRGSTCGRDRAATRRCGPRSRPRTQCCAAPA